MPHVILTVVDVNVSLGVCLGGGLRRKGKLTGELSLPKVFSEWSKKTLYD